MDNPDVVLEFKRDEHGRVVSVAYKVNNEGKDGKRALEGIEIMTSAIDAVFASEGPEDHSVYIPVDTHIG